MGYFIKEGQGRSETRELRYGKSHSHRKNSNMWEDPEVEKNLSH